MKKLMLSTAILASLATAAGAEPSPFRSAVDPTDLTASQVIGMRIYAADPAQMDAQGEAPMAAGPEEGWSDIGEVHDLVLTREGGVEALLVDLGGFLGIGEHRVAVGMEAIRFVPDASTEDDPDDFFLVMAADRATLEASPIYPEEKTAAVLPAGETGYHPIETAGLSVEALEGTPVFDAENARVGEIARVVLDAKGAPAQAVIDVGGFLGIGEKPVAIELAQLSIAQGATPEDLRAATALSKAELEALPAYQG